MKPIKSLKQIKAENRAAGRYYQSLGDKPLQAMDVEPLARLKPKKSAVQLPHRTEADVLRDCLSLLHRHPKVAIVERHNSGALPDKTGRLVRFNRVRIQGVRGALISDITGTLKSGKPFAFECKEPNWCAPDWNYWSAQDRDGLISEKLARELGQKLYLDAIVKAGGIGLFVTDVGQAIDALERII